MKLSKLLIKLVFLILVLSWHEVADTPIQKAAWLIGTWANKTPGGIVYETWTKQSVSVFLGKSYMIKDHDTTVFENLQLIERQHSLFYIPTVKNQNNNQPVSFSLRSLSNSQVVFENMKHDYPQIISYKKINPDSLVAEISGTKNGQERKQTYPMKRVK